MSKLRIAGKILGVVCFLAALVDFGIGIHAVNKHNAAVKDYWSQEDLCDGPWLPIEFLLLGVGVISFKAGDPDWNKNEDLQ